ncbi:hypothetical protein CM49_04864 [Paenibacillus sp. P1XP2]|nr:hypothetical protein CM49_04864 [Paenibacillus sp. P1XP2]
MDKFENFNKKTPAVLLLLFIGVMLALNLAAPDRTFSDSENRMLKQLPHFTFESLLSGAFTSDFEAYVSDQFALRDLWIGAKTDADRAMGKKESNGVYLGKGGYLIQKFVPPAEGDLEAKMQAIHAFDQATPGLRKYAMIVPTAAAVLQAKLPRYAETGAEEVYLGKVRQMMLPASVLSMCSPHYMLYGSSPFFIEPTTTGRRKGLMPPIWSCASTWG